MAVGDVVSGVSAVTTALSFQPAVGVSVCITSVSSYTAWTRINDSSAGTSALVQEMGGANMGTAGAGTNMNTARSCLIGQTMRINPHYPFISFPVVRITWRLSF